MKLYSLGQQDRNYLKSLFYAHTSNFEHPVPRVCSSARITENKPILKFDWRIALCPNHGFKEVMSYCPAICPHWKSLLDDDPLSRNMDCRLSHGQGHCCAECGGLRQCR